MFKRKAFFLPGLHGQLFSIHYLPNGPVKSHIVVFPPFAEELNRSRRAMSSTASLLAKNGFSVLIVDLFGTGDSEGNFEDSSWKIWKSDMLCAIEFLREYKTAPISFLTIRLGTLLALDILGENQSYPSPINVSNFVAWQPIFNTHKYIKQFLRIQMVANLLSPASLKTTEAIKDKIYQNGLMEIAGYPFSAALMDEILSVCISQGMNFDLNPIKKLTFVQITSGSTNNFSEDIQNFILDKADTREKIKIRLLKGSPFWQTHEALEIPNLSKLSLENFIHV